MNQTWKSLLEDRNRFFWVLQAAGWSGYALVHYIGSLMHEMRDIYVLILLLGAYAGFLITVPLRYLYRRIWDATPWLLIVVVLAASYVSAALWAVIDNATYWEIYKFGFRPDSPWFYFKNTIAKFYIMLSWSGLYFGIKYYQMLQEEKQKALLATSMAHQAQLKMLRYQLNPHFLFNTLNAISTLILVKENELANRMMSKLSLFLRFSLDNEPIKKIPLEREIEALMLYLDIEKVRFDERLKVSLDIDDEVKQALVPSLMLQPLIENSIKYAIGKMEDGGEIIVKAQRFSEDLLISVADNGPGSKKPIKDMMKQGGVGLVNTRERLQALYGKNYSFTLAENKPQGLRVEIRIPFEQVES
ncbi:MULTISPECIES: sensor histidine kinase [Idiomarina]|uniref:sensor histidine kinase n=1 Tax=Idiomarina TaxID=135575 RepID=UPI00129B2D06|nr:MULTISPECIES: histidine kinase [Idiomarina]MRJ40846.1 sensor histidine kinase [Idiomarina sp. FeN1]NCU56650.1 sensor histidine kinase [Idiomarina sp. FenA--70]NCU59030.1 sensor histidine kinase [Idiomarina sp. FenBw--71]UUN14476.1 histidine kinase [Idiomarina loihiensis]